MAYSPDGRFIVTGLEGSTAEFWDASDGRELFELKGHTDSICSLAFSPDGERIITGSRDQTARVWDTTTGRELLTFKGNGMWPIPVAFSPDGRRIVTGAEEQGARVWEAASPAQVSQWQAEEQATANALREEQIRILTGRKRTGESN